MKSKILMVVIIAFVFIMTITVFLKNTFTEENKYIHHKQPHMVFISKQKNVIIRKESPLLTPVESSFYDPNKVLFDGFDKQELNKYYWNVMEREDNYNKEMQSYVKDNVFIEDNNLVIIAKNEDKLYTSGLVNTKSKIEFLYGTVTVRLKYPEGKSFFPAVWMLPANDTSYPEIDIMEVVGHKPDTVYFVYHYHNGEKRKFAYKSNIVDYDAYHTYTLQWTPESLAWYIDDEQIFQVTRDIPDEPMYLIINFAIGGVWPGAPDANTVFPSKVLIDYVKIVPYELYKREKINDIY